ncbi:MAG: hypothetical protein IJF46_00080 [Bacteroidaceae bacterium]|nr:hypothetical protein [Bacteroidaceae bacterium]
MSRFIENDDYLLNDDERRKKDGFLRGGVGATVSAEDKEYMNGLASEMKLAGEQMERSRRRLDAWEATDWDAYYKNSQKNFLVPKDSEERRRRQFVTTPKVVDDAIDDYYNEAFRPKMQAERKAADERAFEAYKSYATVPGANASLALGNLYKESNPIVTLDKAMAAPDDGRLDAIANRYAQYAGLDPTEYRKQILEPALRQRAIKELVDENTPKSTAEYLLRGARRNSLMGSMADLETFGYKGAEGHRYIDDLAMENYNPSRTERFAAGVGGLLLDGVVFSGLGAGAAALTGKATNAVVNRAVSKMMLDGAAKGLTREAAEATAKKAVLGSLKTKIAQSASTQGLTLGAYDAAHSVVDDILHGENIDVAAAASAFGHGAATGAAVGAVGTPLRHAAKGLTGGRRIASSAGILSAESAVFTASNELGKMAEGVEIEPIDLVNDFGESAATLLSMRMLHWRPSGASNKLNTVGRLKPELRFSMPEAEEIRRAGVNPDQFIENFEKSLNIYSAGSEKAARDVKMDYLRLMSLPDLSISARSKLLYIVENKLSSTPPEAVDYKVRDKGDGSYVFSTIDAEGRLLENIKCRGREELKSLYFTRTGQLRRNRIAMHERMLMQSYDSQNFFRQAGKYARETGTDVETISDIMYRKARKEELAPEEQAVLDDILRRSNYSDSEVGQMLYSLRRSLEEQYGLNDGSLLGAIEKSAFHCSEAENAALNKYEQIMRGEVLKLHEGTSRRRADELTASDNDYVGLGNDELKKQEQQDFTTRAIITGEGLNEGAVPTFTEQYGIFASDIRKPKNWDERYVWSPYRHKHTREDVDRMAKEAIDLGEALGVKINVIVDESQIPTTIAEYDIKLRSLGWLNEMNGEITINVPNSKNIDEVRRTVVHEAVGHRGFGQLFGYYYFDFLEELYMRSDANVRKSIDDIASKNAFHLHKAVDEYIAKLSERTITTPEQRSIYQRFCDFVREMLQRLNIYRKPISEEELVSLIQRHHSATLRHKKYDSYRGSAFRPFETAARSDGGYYDYDIAKARYTREMNENPTLKGLPEGFHKVHRELYDDAPAEPSTYSYRNYGEEGIDRLKDISYFRFKDLDKMKRLKYLDKYYTKRGIYEGWKVTPEGKWYAYTSNTPSETKIYDYVYRTLRVYNPRRAEYYKEIVSKPAHLRTDNEKDALEAMRNTAVQFDSSARLNDILYDWKLFKAYPRIAELPVHFATLKGRNALYDVENKRLIIDKRGFEDPYFRNELYYTMQHVIDDIEGLGNRPVLRDDVERNTIISYNDAQDYIDRSRGLAVVKREPRIRELYRMRLGTDLEELREKYPTIEDYLDDNTHFRWPDNRGKALRSYSTNNEELRGFLGGPLDIIEKVLENAPRDGRDMTLREAEELRSFSFGIPQYELPRYVPLPVLKKNSLVPVTKERFEPQKPKTRSIEDILREFNFLYGSGDNSIQSKYIKINRTKGGYIPPYKQNYLDADGNSPFRPLEEILKEFNEKYGK